MTTALDIIRHKRDGQALSADEISHVIAEFTRGQIEPSQMAAFLMAIECQGMNSTETLALTAAMLHCGRVLSWPTLRQPKIGYYSWGGIGDKTVLVLAPLMASLGICVPLILPQAAGMHSYSWDLWEAIPGFRTDLSLYDFERGVEQLQVAVMRQTAEIAPASVDLVSLQSSTGTAESVALLTARILSQKLAEGIDGLVVDLKSGQGALWSDQGQVLDLAHTLMDTATHLGKPVVVVITDLNQPVGRSIGTALEVQEAQDVLRGQVKSRFGQLILELAAQMILLAGGAISLMAAKSQALEAITSGQALEKWQQLIHAQGGDDRVVQEESCLPQAAHRHTVTASESGYITGIDSQVIGQAAMVLGARRQTSSSVIDPAAGLQLHVELGTSVNVGDPLVTLHTNDAEGLAEALARLDQAFTLESEPSLVPDIIHLMVTPNPKPTRRPRMGQEGWADLSGATFG
jgi:pyrimidine-nucleoside phosphorylase/thymidine phosphorylase